MTDPALFQEVKMTAMYFAYRLFQRANPAATDDEAYRHAERLWRLHVPMALDYIAVCRVDDEARAAAASN